MADSTLDSELFTLNDFWPGSPNPNLSVPTDGFTGATHHNVAAETDYVVGTKIQVYCDGSVGQKGFSVLIYLQVGTQNADSVLAAKSVVVQDSATVWYQVTNDADSCIKIPTALAAIALSAMTNAYYGWFWCGGVCPEQYVSGLGGNYATEGSVAAGPITAHDLAADYIGLGNAADLADAGVPEPVWGYALAADA